MCRDGSSDMMEVTKSCNSHTLYCMPVILVPFHVWQNRYQHSTGVGCLILVFFQSASHEVMACHAAAVGHFTGTSSRNHTHPSGSGFIKPTQNIRVIFRISIKGHDIPMAKKLNSYHFDINVILKCKDIINVTASNAPSDDKVAILTDNVFCSILCYVRPCHDSLWLHILFLPLTAYQFSGSHTLEGTHIS